MKKLIIILLFYLFSGIYATAQRIYPDLYYPEHNAYTQDTVIILRWNTSSVGSPQQFQLSSDSLFTNLLINQQQIDPAIDVWEVKCVPGKTYFWRVGNFNGFSRIFKFTCFNPKVIRRLHVWFDATEGVVASANKLVNQWIDLSGNGNDAIQTNPGLAPTYINHSVLGASLKFVNSTMLFTVSPSNSYSFFFVVNPIQRPSLYGIYLGTRGANVSGMRWGFGLSQADPAFGLGWGRDSDLGLGNANFFTLNQPRVMSFLKSSSNWNIYQNSNFVRSVADNSAPTSTGKGTWVLGAESAGLSYQMNVEFKKILIYDTLISDPDRRMLEGYLQYTCAPPVNLGKDKVGCGVVIDAGAYLSYKWSTGDTIPSIIATVPGVYHVSVKDIFGRFSTDTIRVLNPVATNNPAVNTMCIGDTITWDPQLPADKYTIHWNGSSSNTSPVLIITQPGVYTLQAVDQASTCTIRDTFAIVSPLLQNLKTKISLGGDTSFCKGNLISLRKGAAEVKNYKWNDGTNAKNLSIISQGNYWVNVKSYNGCTARDTINILAINGVAPLANFRYDTLCGGKSSKLYDLSFTPDATGITKRYWWVNNMVIDSVSNNPILTGGLIGSKNIRLTVISGNGCTANIEKNINVYPKPDVKFANTSACNNDTTNFSSQSTIVGGNIISWKWSFGNIFSLVKAPKVVFPIADNYPVQLINTSDKGCRDTLSKVLFVKQKVSADFRYTESCVGVPVVFSESTNYPDTLSNMSRIWSLGDSILTSAVSPVKNYTVSGVYPVSLTITASNGCKSTVTRLVRANAYPIANFSFAGNCLGQSTKMVDLSKVANDTIRSWYWNIHNFKISIDQNPTYIFPDTGYYDVTLSAAARGCSSTIKKNIHIFYRPKATFSYSPLIATPPVIITFTGISAKNQEYLWSFDNMQNAPVAIYELRREGTYPIHLKVTSDNGCQDSSQVNIEVNNPRWDIELAGMAAYKSKSQNSYRIDVRLANKGNRRIDSVNLVLTLPEDYILQQTWYGKLERGGDTVFSMPIAVTKSNEILDYYCLKAVLADEVADIDPDNNVKCEVLSGTPQIYKIGPNPTSVNTSITYTLSTKSEVQYTLKTILGEIIRQEKRESPSGVYQLDVPLQGLPDGMYILEVNIGGTNKLFRIVKN